MTDSINIRNSTQEDWPALARLYPDAFPDEDLLPLVSDLHQETREILSLVGSLRNAVTSHVIFTFCGIPGTALKAALLGPLAVAPAYQRQGFGTAIVRKGLRILRARP